MVFFSRSLANHSAYSNHGTQVGALNKDFSAVLQTILIRGFSAAVCGADYRYDAYFKL